MKEWDGKVCKSELAEEEFVGIYQHIGQTDPLINQENLQ